MNSQKYIICSVLILSLLLARPSSGALKGFLQLAGKTQGSIDGESTEPGREGWIEVLSFEHSVTIPRDPNSGQPKSGKTHHQPLKLTKCIDKASPKLLEAWKNSEEFSTFRLESMRLDGGIPVNYYTVELLNAEIVGIGQVKLNTDNPDNDWSQDMESVYFLYDTVTRTFEDGSITSEANWDYEETRVLRISDLNYDGNVDMFDVAVLASEWLAEY